MNALLEDSLAAKPDPADSESAAARMTFRPVVLVPSYNNARTLPAILQRIEASGNLPILVVNDGSTDATADILRDWQAAGHPLPVLVETHARNRGKAAALRTGFAAAGLLGYTHAITIDSDGQLDPEQIPEFAAAAGEHPGALVLGARDDTRADYPARSRLGRRISNAMIRTECGARVSDSQCGLRVYPLDFTRSVPCRAGRFGFEAEIITRAGWAGCRIVEVPTNCVYLPPGQRISHFRPFVDTLRGFRMHLLLLLRSLVPWPHRQWIAPGQPPIPKRPLWQRLLHWVSPRKAWRQMRDEPGGATRFAAALAVGVFIANLPLYPLQTLVSLYAARRLRLHPLPVVVGSNISIPPIGLAMIAAAIGIGHFLLHGNWPHWIDYDFARMGGSAGFKAAGWTLVEWWIGGLLMGFAMALLSFGLSAGLLQWFKNRPKNSPHSAGAAPAPAPLAATSQTHGLNANSANIR